MLYHLCLLICHCFGPEVNFAIFKNSQALLNKFSLTALKIKIEFFLKKLLVTFSFNATLGSRILTYSAWRVPVCQLGLLTLF